MFKTKLFLLPLLSLVLTHGNLSAQGVPPIRFQLYDSLTTDVSRSQARAFTRPMIELLSERLEHPIEFGFHEAGDAKQLSEFGRKLDTGIIHIGVVWGTEYGILRQNYDKLEPLVICALSGRIGNAAQLMVRRGKELPRLDDLRGRTLLRARRMPLVNSLYLQSLLDQKGDNFFDVKSPAKPSSKSALLAVRGDGDDSLVALVDFYAYVKFRESHQVVADDLVSVAKSDWFPLPAVIANPGQLQGLRPGLRGQLVKQLLAIHNSAEGRQVIKFWRFDRFRKPDAEFERFVRESVETYQKFLQP